MENIPEHSTTNLIATNKTEPNESLISLEDTHYSPEEIKKVMELVVQQEHEISFLNTLLETLKDKLEEAEKHLFEDKLTGCFNINYFNKIKEENFNPELDKNRIAVSFIDANGLKELNDTPIELGGGHDAGDQMIVGISKYLRKNVREEDIVIRPYGFGDEFIIIIRNSSGDNYFGEYINFRMNIITAGAKEQNPPLDFATGTAIFGDKDTTLDDTKKRAETAMYLNKTNMKKPTPPAEV